MKYNTIQCKYKYKYKRLCADNDMIPPDTLHGIKGVRSALLCNSTRLNSWIFSTTMPTMTHKFSSTPLYPTLGKVHSATLQLSIFAGAIFPYRLQYWRRTPSLHYFVYGTARTVSHYLKVTCCLLFMTSLHGCTFRVKTVIRRDSLVKS